MIELLRLADKLQETLNDKEHELSSQSNYTSYTMAEVKNRQNDINYFRLSIKEVDTNPFSKQTIIKNFTENANKIYEDIKKLNN